MKYVLWQRQHFLFPQKRGEKIFLLHCWGTCSSPGKRSGVKGGCDATLINDHHINKWQAANAAMEWNITIRPGCKGRVRLCLWALPELDKLWWLSRDSVRFPSLAQAQPSHRWQLLEMAPPLGITTPSLKTQLGPVLLLVGVRSPEGGMLIISDLPFLHVGCVDGGMWPSSSLVCVLRTWSGSRRQWRERKLCFPVSFLSVKALAWKPDHPPCCLSVLHLALRAPVACKVAKKRNSPRKTRKRLQVHSPKHHAAGQVWGKLFTFLRRKEILRNKLVTSPKMAQFCCTFSRTCGKTTVLAPLVLPRVKAKGSFLLWGHLFRVLQWKILQTSAVRRWRCVMQSSYHSHPHLIVQ